MRSFPALVTAELVKDGITICHLFKLESTITYRWTDCDQDIYLDSWWSNKNLKFSDFQFDLSAKIPSVSWNFPNADKWFSDMVLAGEIKGKPFTIYRILIDRNLQVIGYASESEITPFFRGMIDQIPEMDRLDARASAVSHRITERGIGPKGDFSGLCWKVFKSVHCTYAGAETWCDFTKGRCVALNNAINFGGWEYISDLSTKEIYWGRRTKNWGK